MIFFPAGIKLAQDEYSALLYIKADPEEWLREAVTEKSLRRGEALINEWHPRLFANPEITELPADRDALLALIMTQPGYKTRLQQDAEQVPPEPVNRHNSDRYAAKVRPSRDQVTLFSTGIDVPIIDCACILAYVQDIEEWLYGALLGQINRGKKKMIRQYQSVLLADPDVATFPANQDELIQLITSRSDYESLPAQEMRVAWEMTQKRADSIV